MKEQRFAFDAAGDRKTVGDLVSKVLAREGLLQLAVAYVSGDAVRQLRLEGRDLRVLSLLCDPFGGGCDPAQLNRLAKAGATIYCLERLHAKVYITHDAVVVGSMNLSGPALERGNVEAGVVVNDRDAVQAAMAWFDILAKRARPWASICDDLPVYAQIATAWAARQIRRQAIRKKPTLLEALVHPHEHPWAEVVFSLYNENLDNAGFKQALDIGQKTLAFRTAKVTPDITENATDKDRRRRDHECIGSGGSPKTVIEVWVTLDRNGRIKRFDSIAREPMQYVGAVLKDSVLYGYYQPWTVWFDMESLSRKAAVTALNNGLARDISTVHALDPANSMVTPAELSTILGYGQSHPSSRVGVRRRI